MIAGNIRKYYIFSFIYSMYLWLPVWVLFLLEKGFSLTQITLLDTFYFITIFAISVPTGILSDKIGRKKALSSGSLLTALALFLFAESDGVASVMCSFFVWACGLTLSGVSGTAFLFDTLKMMGREEEFKKINGQSLFFANVSMAISSLLGGFMAGISLKLPILVAAGLCLISFLITLSFTEPLSFPTKESYMSHLKESVNFTRSVPPLMMLVVLGMCVSLFTYMALLFAQPYLIRVGKSLAFIGIMYFFFNLAIALSAPLAHVVERKIGERKIVLIIPASFLLCFLFLSVGRLVIPAFIALNVASGFSQPLLNDYLNRRIPTEKRGTVTSFQTALLAAVQLFFEPALGYTSDRFSLKTSFLLLSCACVILFLFTLSNRSSLKHPSGEHK